MTLRNILVFPDPRLREVAKEVKVFDEKLKNEELPEEPLVLMNEVKNESGQEIEQENQILSHLILHLIFH